MASLSKDPKGNVTVQFVGGDKRRRSVRLGKVPRKLAESVKLKVEHLAALAAARLPWDSETALWVGGIGEDLAAKLAAVGLVPARRAGRLLGEFLREYVERRRLDGAKPNTVTNISRVAEELIAAFGAATPLRAVTPEQAEGFKAGYVARGLAATTVYRQLKFAKQLFAQAVKEKLLDANPFAEVKGRNSTPTDRRRYVTAADADRLIAAATPLWRVIVALARFGGLRCPSEVLSLRWEHIDFAADRMTVTAPKTEHLEGKAYRVVPLFPQLRPVLAEAFDLAAPGEQYVVGGPQGASYRAAAGREWKGASLGSRCAKLVRRAGLPALPKPFVNMRSSCETDLMTAGHSIHVVTAWLGNTPAVALTHYLQTTEADFAKAVRGSGAESGAGALQKAVLTTTDSSGPEGTGDAKRAGKKGVLSTSDWSGQTLSARVGEGKYTRQELNL